MSYAPIRACGRGRSGGPQSISETLVWSTPYILGGLAVAFAFKAGLFNIGVEGQISLGALASVFVGYAVKDVPFPFHALLAITVGALAGAPVGGDSRLPQGQRRARTK